MVWIPWKRMSVMVSLSRSGLKYVKGSAIKDERLLSVEFIELSEVWKRMWEKRKKRFDQR